MNAAEGPVRILMADDEEVFLQATADLLRREGYLVDTARDGLEATQFLKENTYDFLVSDLMMPGNHDLDFLKLAAEMSPDLHMILVTGYPSVSTAQGAIQLPVVAYLVKPLELDELLLHLRRGVASVRMHRTLRRTRERVLDWVDDMGKMQELMRGMPQAQDQDSARTVLGLALGNMAALMLDMKELFEQSFSKGAVASFCGIQNCPRLLRYEDALREAIATLEHTRHAFKSRELALLRERIEALLSGPPQPP